MPIEPTQALDFTGYRVLVAGGSRGIGRAIALAFARAGAHVSACARGEAGLTALQQDAKELPGSIHVHAGDLGSDEGVQAWVDVAANALNGIDVLVNNATGYGFDGRKDAHWEADFNIDLMAAVRGSRAARPWLEQSPHASIIHTSSISALKPRPAGPPYAALKAALNHYTTSQALMLAPKGIRVNAIAPGSVDFPDGMWDRIHRDDPERYAAVLAKIPFGRYGRPEDIANVALFLASPLAAWVTGQIIAVDGGQILTG